MTKKTYKIIYLETLVHTFYIDADSPEEAEEQFDKLSKDGKLDFSDGEVYDSSITMQELKEESNCK